MKEWMNIDGTLIPHGKAAASYMGGVPNRGIVTLEPPKQESGITKQQRKAVHKYLRMLATEFNDKNIGMKTFFNKPEIEIMITMEILKEALWKVMSKAIFKVESSEDLEPGQVDKVYNAINDWTTLEHGISVRFPKWEDIAK